MGLLGISWLAQGEERLSEPPPPPPTHSPIRIMARSWQPRPKSRMASILETVSVTAELGQQLWSCTNFRCSDRTLRSRDRIFDFSQEIVKICAGAENWAPAEILIGRAGTTSRHSTGETPPIKAERPEPSDHSRSKCLRINTIYEDLNESSSARLGGSQQLEILPSPNSKRAPNFSTWILIGTEILRFRNFRGAVILPGAEISTSAIVLSHITRRVNSVCPPKFSAANFRSNFLQQISVAIFCLNFTHPPQFSWDAEISCICNILSRC